MVSDRDVGHADADYAWLGELDRHVAGIGSELAMFLVFDRPGRAADRPGLERAHFARRCVSDEQLSQTVEAFRSLGAYVEVFDGEKPFIEALASGRLQRIGRPLKVVYNGIEGSIAPDAFKPGRKSLIPAVADVYGLTCVNSNAYGCGIGRHKYHYLTLLSRLGVRTPSTWHFRRHRGWAGGMRPPAGTKVIVKSTYEAWSVGVTEDSVFFVDESVDRRVTALADEIGQPVTVQEFIAGREICVPVLSSPARFATPPVEVVLAKAPGDPSAFMTLADNLAAAGVGYEVMAPGALTARLATEACAAFDGLELEGFARIDFRVDQHATTYLIDVGVSPGLSMHGSAYRSIGSLGYSHEQFLRIVVGATLASRGVFS